jgi:hypothetical protein
MDVTTRQFRGNYENGKYGKGYQNSAGEYQVYFTSQI